MNWQQGEGKIVNSLMRVRAREGGFPSPHSFLHPPFVFAEKARCFSRKDVGCFWKIYVFLQGGDEGLWREIRFWKRIENTAVR